MSGYGNRTRNDRAEQHPGVDIGKQDPGTGRWQSGIPVKAGCKGTVVKVYKFDGKHYPKTASAADWFKNFNMVVIKCTEGEFAGKFIVFAHFSSISVKEGDPVNPGTEVGKIGGYGKRCANSTPPHVHIEVRTPDKDNPKTPEDEGAWDGPDETRAKRGSYKESQDPITPPPPPKRNGKASGHSLPGGGNWRTFGYSVENDSTSEGPIEYFRVRYAVTLPYTNVTAPPGWSSEPFGESPEAVTWYAVSPGAGVYPGQTLDGFSFDAETVSAVLLPFSFGPDDAGLGPDESAEFLVIGAGTATGGTTELLVDGSGAPASAAEGSGSSAPPYAAIAGGLAAAVLALTAGAWYARRRFSRG
jgi:hypothetical protein